MDMKRNLVAKNLIVDFLDPIMLLSIEVYLEFAQIPVRVNLGLINQIRIVINN